MTKDEAGAEPRRMWVICEGKHEQDGSLETLIRRLRDDAPTWEIECEPWKNPRGDRRRFRSTGQGDGVFKKLIASLIDGTERGFDAVICVIDRDRDSARRDSVAKAQASDRCPLPRAFGVAIESYDAWFLADEVALSGVAARSIQRQPDPEATRDPKMVTKELCGGPPSNHPPLGGSRGTSGEGPIAA